MSINSGILPKQKNCPKCGRTRKSECFDTRYMSGVVHLQSWCRECRSAGKKVAHAKPPVKNAKPATQLMKELGITPVRVIQLTDNVKQIRDLYVANFPGDRLKHSRPWRHMIARLVNKLGADNVSLTVEARDKYKKGK
jgi:hypothetical protein